MYTISPDTATARPVQQLVRRRCWTAALALASCASAMTATGAATAAPSPQEATVVAKDPISCPSVICRRAARNTSGDRTFALDGKGRAYFTHTSGVLYEVDLATGDKRQVTSGLGWINSVTLDSNGNALVPSHSDNGVLWTVNVETGEKDEVTTGLGSPDFLTLKGNTAYITAWWQAALWKVDITTGEKAKIASLSHIDGVATDGQHAFLTTTLGQLYRLRLSDGAMTLLAKDLGYLTVPTVDPAGNVYVGNHAGVLYRVDEKGAIRQVATGLGTVWGVALDGTGDAYVSNQEGVLWRVPKVAEPSTPPARAGIVDIRGVTAKVGGSAVPQVRITNIGSTRITKQTVTLQLGPGVNFKPWREVYLKGERNGEPRVYPCNVREDHRSAVCPDVDLNLDPGKNTPMWTEVETNRDLQVGDIPHVRFTVGDLGSAKADFKLVP